MTEYRTLNDATAPTIWPQCDCGVTYVFRKALSFSGMKWVWMRDCKHPEMQAEIDRLRFELDATRADADRLAVIADDAFDNAHRESAIRIIEAALAEHQALVAKRQP